MLTFQNIFKDWNLENFFFFPPSPTTPLNFLLPLPLRLLFVLLVQRQHVGLGDPCPTFAVDVVQVDLPSAVGVTVRRLVDGTAAQLASLLHTEAVPQAAVHYAIGVHGA